MKLPFLTRSYKYHVVYHHRKGYLNGVGSTEITVNKKMSYRQVIEDVREHIANQDSFDNVIIINFIKLKG